MFKVIKRAFLRWPLRPFIYYTTAIIAVYLLFFWRLGSLTAGLNSAEAATRSDSLSLHNIYLHPVNAPYHLLQHFFYNIGGHNNSFLRLSSVIFGLILAYCFYRLMVVWFGKSIGSLAAILFVTTPFFVLTTRQASADVMFFAPVALMAVYVWLLRSEEHKTLAWLVLLISSALFLYTPGIIWWIIGAFIICRNKLIMSIETVPSWVTAAGFGIILMILAPLIVSIVSDWTIIKGLGPIPSHWPDAMQVLKNISWMFLAVFVKTPYHHVLLIGRLPLLDILQAALLVFGVYAMWSAARAKAYTLGLGVGLAIILAGLNNNIMLLALGLPALAIFVGAGLRYLYIEWRAIFPLNPVPKTLALLLIAAAVAVQALYGISYSLAAWPNTVATHNAYMIK